MTTVGHDGGQGPQARVVDRVFGVQVVFHQRGDADDVFAGQRRQLASGVLDLHVGAHEHLMAALDLGGGTQLVDPGGDACLQTTTDDVAAAFGSGQRPLGGALESVGSHEREVGAGDAFLHGGDGGIRAKAGSLSQLVGLGDPQPATDVDEGQVELHGAIELIERGDDGGLELAVAHGNVDGDLGIVARVARLHRQAGQQLPHGLIPLGAPLGLAAAGAAGLKAHRAGDLEVMLEGRQLGDGRGHCWRVGSHRRRAAGDEGGSDDGCGTGELLNHGQSLVRHRVRRPAPLSIHRRAQALFGEEW